MNFFINNFFLRTVRILLFIAVAVGAIYLWQNYAPLSEAFGVKIRFACYFATGTLFIATLAYPLAGLLLLCLFTPLLNAVPLYLSNGSPYPIVLFTSIGFVAGWLARESVQPSEYKLFRGQKWIFVFAVMLVISAVASFLRYSPGFQWTNVEFLKQAVNTKQTVREDAVRYIIFVFANEIIAIFIIAAAYSIIRKYKKLNYKIENLVVWTILFGAVCAATVAVYQAQWDVLKDVYEKVFDKNFPPNAIQFCANKSYYWIRLRRVNGTCTDPNALGALIALCVSIASAKIIFSGSWKSISAWIQKVLVSLAVAILVLGIYFSGSRSGLLAVGLTTYIILFSAILYYLNLLFKLIKIKNIVRVVTIFISGFFIIYGSYAALPKIINSLEKISVTRSSASLLRRLKRDLRLFKRAGEKPMGILKDNRRMLYWNYAEKICKDFPFTGIGLGAYVIELPNYTSANKERLYRTDNACNYYLNFAAEMGLPAIFALGLFFITLYSGLFYKKSLYKKLSTNQKHLRFVFAIALPVYLVVLIFGVHTLSNEVIVIFSIFLALIAANNDAVFSQKQTQNKLVKYSISLLIFIVLLLYAWKTYENNKNSLNSERRNAVYGLKNETGFYKWEKWKNIPFKVRWMGKMATSTVERKNLFLGIPVMSNAPDLSTNNPIKISFFINGLKVQNHTIKKPGEWTLVKFFVPFANPFIKNIAPHTSIRIEADRTWMPKASKENDTRKLSVLTGEFRWLEPEKDEGGWYKKELWNNEKPFAWSGIHAYRSVIVNSNKYIKIPMYASNLFLKKFPLNVAIYFNGKFLDTITFRDKSWKNYRYPLPKNCKQNSINIIEFVAERTWMPKHYGFEDTRNFGIAVGEITLE